MAKRAKRYIELEKKMIEHGDTHQTLCEYLEMSEATLWRRRYGDFEWTIPEIVKLQKRYRFTEAQLLTLILDQDMIRELSHKELA